MDLCHGELILDLEGGKIFSVTQHQNNPNLNFLTIESRRVELHHKGELLIHLKGAMHLETKIPLIVSHMRSLLNFFFSLKPAYRYISKNLNMKKVNIFCHSFQKVKPIYYKD